MTKMLGLGFSMISPFCPSRVAGGGEGGGGLTPAMTLNSAAGIGVDDLRRLCILRSLCETFSSFS